jgi:hypothetical protein
MANALDIPPLGLTDAEADARFAALQKKLVPLWKSMRAMSQDEQTIVVAPSISIDFEAPPAVIQAYEERFLFLLLLLRQPRARLVYITSQGIHPSIIDYYLAQMPGVIPSHARRRLFLPAPLDGSPAPLSAKLLARPKLLAEIRSLVVDPDRAHLIAFNTTRLERDLALRLGIPLYGADPKFEPLGTKSGCRRLFAEEGVAHPLGIENLSSLDEVVAALARMRAERPAMRQALVKLNEGVSGEGNALVDLAGLPPPGGPGETTALGERLRAMQFEKPDATFDDYVEKLRERGGVVEERITGEEFRSPSVQLRVTPLGELELLSTHDQLLGGKSGQSYLGCVFPADPAYAATISREAAKVGRRLAREGVIGRFALDFVAVRDAGGEWRAYAIELNLRKGGTTHPFLTLQFLTDGSYDAERAVFTAPSGRAKCFVASDHVKSPLYRALTPDDLIDIAVRHRLQFDQSRQTGVVFHMLSALPAAGRVGLTAVGDSPAEADALYRRAVEILDAEARAALTDRGLPPV